MPSSQTPSRRYRLVLLALVGAFCAAPPVWGEDRRSSSGAIPPAEMVDFLLVMDAMESFGDAIDLETELHAQEQEQQKPQPSSGEGG